MKPGECVNCFQVAEIFDRGLHRKGLCQECFSKFEIERRLAFKVKAVDFLGGKCSECGYNKCLAVLEFHHIDDSEKDGEIGTIISRSRWDLLETELLKCILLCSNCHAKKHNSLTIEEFQKNRRFKDKRFA